MNLEFSKLIREIEAELKTEYMPNAIRYCDEHFDGVWSAAIDRFESALRKAISMNNYAEAKREGEIYKATILDLLKKFKIANKKDDVKSFIDSIRKTS